jgi:WD40 repeat protein
MMPVSALAVRDSRLVVASANGIVRLYDVHTLAPWMQINAASRFVSALALHPTRDCFAVAAEDGTLNVFSLPPVNHQVGPPSHPHTLTPSHPHTRCTPRATASPWRRRTARSTSSRCHQVGRHSSDVQVAKRTIRVVHGATENGP